MLNLMIIMQIYQKSNYVYIKDKNNIEKSLLYLFFFTKKLFNTLINFFVY